MKVILFNGQDLPTTGQLFVADQIYTVHDGIYGPQVAVILQEVTDDSPYQHLQSDLVPEVGNRPKKA